MSVGSGDAAPDRGTTGAGAPPVPPLALPRRIDLDHALQVYVAGRSRNWTEDEKRTAAARGKRIAAASPEVPEAGDAPRAAAPRAGVRVPERLAFHRSAGTWRVAVPGGLPRPRSGGHSG